MRSLAKSLWQQRSYILGTVRREFELRYVRSLFGFVWTILEPLSMIIVYTLIFSTIMKARLPGLDDSWSYSIYLCTGILFWTFFSEVVNRCQTMFITEASLLKKSNFPRLSLPCIILISAALNWVIFSVLFVLFLALIDRLPGASIVLMFPLVGLVALIALGFGVLTGTLNVFFRDVGKSVGIFMTFWFWMTPIVYPIDILPTTLREIILLINPLVPIVAFAQSILLGTESPESSTLMFPAILSIALLLLGYTAFKRLSADMVDEL